MIDFTVKPDGAEPYQVTATARDVLVWEKAAKSRTFVKMMSELPLADLYIIAHIASRRHGLFSGNLHDFENSVDLVFEGEDEDSADPTPPAVSPDSA